MLEKKLYDCDDRARRSSSNLLGCLCRVKNMHYDLQNKSIEMVRKLYFILMSQTRDRSHDLDTGLSLCLVESAHMTWILPSDWHLKAVLK